MAAESLSAPTSSSSSSPMPSILGGGQGVEERVWLVSLVKSEGEHAFLLVEGIQEGIPRYLRSDLLLSSPRSSSDSSFTESVGNLFGNLVGRVFLRVRDIPPEEYELLLTQREHQSWSITRPQVEKLITRLEKERDEPHHYTYSITGNHPSSMVSSSVSSKEPHNCVSWCQKILSEELGIEISSRWIPIKYPSTVVRKAIAAAEGRAVVPAPVPPTPQTPAAEADSSSSAPSKSPSLASRMGGF